jgi:hypothetical protein
MPKDISFSPLHLLKSLPFPLSTFLEPLLKLIYFCPVLCICFVCLFVFVLLYWGLDSGPTP